MRGMPDDPQLGAVDPPPGLEQDVEALVGPQQPEEQHDRPLDRRQLRRERVGGRQLGEVGRTRRAG